MRIIGITGGIGTGKSTILSILKKEPNSFIVEAVTLAHQLMEQGQAAYKKIVDVFGKDILDSNGNINRNVLGKIVFEDVNLLKQLNEIVHPAVKKYILSDIQKKSEQGFQNYIIEAALLIEDGYKEVCDEIWYVYVEKEERIRRLIKGRGGNRDKWEAVIQNQSSDDYYRQYSDFVIDNGENLTKTEDVVKELLFKSG
ncbi:MAG: dephospho-CoA kinase [Lachnospiraceae bacterium]|nr:dephospho-CoA kinase [Lachnospiraceae bacterium]